MTDETKVGVDDGWSDRGGRGGDIERAHAEGYAQCCKDATAVTVMRLSFAAIDRRDARIAELRAEVERLRGDLDAVDAVLSRHVEIKTSEQRCDIASGWLEVADTNRREVERLQARPEIRPHGQRWAIHWHGSATMTDGREQVSYVDTPEECQRLLDRVLSQS